MKLNKEIQLLIFNINGKIFKNKIIINNKFYKLSKLKLKQLNVK